MEGNEAKMTWKHGNEEVELEDWAWEVTYLDGTSFKQFGDDGTFHQFQEIKQDQVAEFRMVRTQGKPQVHRLYVKDGMRIFHFYKRDRWKGAGFERRSTTYVFGWKNGNGSATYLYILPSGNLMIGSEGELTFTGDVAQKELGIA